MEHWYSFDLAMILVEKLRKSRKRRKIDKDIEAVVANFNEYQFHVENQWLELEEKRKKMEEKHWKRMEEKETNFYNR